MRRHLPLALYGLALAAVAIALARPEATVAVPEERAAVVLATDISGSMEATDVQPSRIAAVRRAARDFLGEAPKELRVGAVAFNHAVRSIEPPRADREDTRALVDGLTPSGGTATGEGLAAAVGLLARRGAQDERRPPAAVILLSDGTSTHGRDPIGVAREAARLKIPIYTVALRHRLRHDRGRAPRRHHRHARGAARPRRRCAGSPRSAERAPSAPSAGDELATVYERLGSQVAMRDEKREVTAAFVGGAAAFLLLGGAMSLRWFGRLP